jgi:hypothetical protein
MRARTEEVIFPTPSGDLIKSIIVKTEDNVIIASVSAMHDNGHSLDDASIIKRVARALTEDGYDIEPDTSNVFSTFTPKETAVAFGEFTITERAIQIG